MRVVAGAAFVSLAAGHGALYIPRPRNAMDGAQLGRPPARAPAYLPPYLPPCCYGHVIVREPTWLGLAQSLLRHRCNYVSRLHMRAVVIDIIRRVQPRSPPGIQGWQEPLGGMHLQ